VALDDEEWHLVRTLREIPPSLLRDSIAELIEALLVFARRPGCPEMQADGVPCTSAHSACDTCQKVLLLLDGVRRRIHTL
jgi:hypothetical protein